MSRIYLAVPIIANRNINQAQLLAKIIEDMGHEIVSKWVANTDPGFTITPQEVFTRDAKGIENCDILIAEITSPSHGVGMEIMLAHIHEKKVICLLRDGAVASRMLRGLPGIRLVEYTSEKELTEKLKEAFDATSL